MKLILDLDLEKCIACGACSVACMDQNDIDVTEGEMPFRTVFAMEKGRRDAVEYLCLSMACMHCDHAPCIKGCPIGCLKKDEATGLVLYDNTSCIGCHSCSLACPFGAPHFNKSGKMVKCDGCKVRQQHGLQPACVRVCPTNALTVCREKDYSNIKAGKSLRRLVDL